MERLDTLRSLQEQLQTATGHSAAIDEQLMALAYVRWKRNIGAQVNDGPNGEWVPSLDDVWFDPRTNKWVSTHAHQFTGSVDDALRLVERLRPNQKMGVLRNAPKNGGHIVTMWAGDVEAQCADYATLPITIVAALVDLLLALEEFGHAQR